MHRRGVLKRHGGLSEGRRIALQLIELVGDTHSVFKNRLERVCATRVKGSHSEEGAADSRTWGRALLSEV